MNRFMEGTYKRSKRKYPAKDYKARYRIKKLEIDEKSLREIKAGWKYRFDPLKGLINLIYPLDLAAVSKYGDCDDYAAKIYYHILGVSKYEPFLITYFTYNITKCHTVVGLKLDNGTYNIYNWSRMYNVPNIDAMRVKAVGRRKVFSTIYSRWNASRFMWYTEQKSNLLHE